MKVTFSEGVKHFSPVRKLFVHGCPSPKFHARRKWRDSPPSQREKWTRPRIALRSGKILLGGNVLMHKEGEKIVRIRPPHRNDDGARRVACKKGYDPQLRNESGGQVFPS
jgi:hypothetical protein